jgi:tripartite-type tricarboxylate transporter receptor subunit TctC
MRQAAWARALMLAVMCALATVSAAQSPYPSKPIRFIVPFPPGGGTDIFSRLLASKLATNLNWSIVVENKAGAGGTIGVDAAAKAAPDGYTLVMGQTSNLAINPSLYSHLPYDALTDLAPVALIASTPLVLVAAGKSPHKSLAELIAAASAKPDALSYASPGSGTVGHLSGELFTRAAGIRMLHVPYKGASPALTDLLGGRVDAYFATAQSVVEYIKAGSVRALAVTSASRVPVLPDVPTIAESGFKGFEATSWNGVLVPAGTPSTIIARLNDEISRMLQFADIRAEAARDGGTILGSSPAQFGAFLKAEHEKWGHAVRAAGVKAD